MMFFEIIETVIDTFMQVLIGYVAYRFFVGYQRTGERLFLAITTGYAIMFVIHLPYLLLHHYMGYPFAYSSLFHEILFILATGTLAWALLPRVIWKSRLEQKPGKAKKKRAA